MKKKKVTAPQAKAFSVHLLTASGSFLAFLSIVAASELRWTAMWWWLGLALLVDGIDGPIARKLEVKEVLPTWSGEDRKSTRLNSSHVKISYAVLCLKKKKEEQKNMNTGR